jgi:PTS system sucrose-specific IIC component
VKETVLYSPMKGEVLPITESEDPAFASKAMGDGIAVNPSEGTVYAPCDGTVTMIFPTKHAVAIQAETGNSFLIHAGIDTVKMEGEGFETFVEAGTKLKQGDKILTFDMDLVKEKGYSTQTMMMLAEGDGQVEVISKTDADTNTQVMIVR